MRQMSGEIVRTELFAGVFAIGQQIARPLIEQRTILTDERIVCAIGNRSFEHDEHISAFFNRHLSARVVDRRGGGIEIIGRVSFFCANAVNGGIDLTGRQRIASDIVRRKVVCPDGHRSKFQHRTAHGIDQLGVIAQKERGRRIADINRADAAVGIVFLGEICHFAFRCGNQLVCRHHLTP